MGGCSHWRSNASRSSTWEPCGTTSTRSLASGASTRWKRIRCSLGRGTSASSRCMNFSGDITMRVAPSRQAVLSHRTTCPTRGPKATRQVHAATCSALSARASSGSAWTNTGPLSVRRYTPSSTRQCRWMLRRLAADPKRWISVTAPLSASSALKPACSCGGRHPGNQAWAMIVVVVNST